MLQFYSVHKSPPLDTVKSQVNSVHTFTPRYLRPILIYKKGA
jgi:hypothetical protein